MYEIRSYLEQQNMDGGDSLAILEKGEDILFSLADGAGGITGGSFASRYITDASKELADIVDFKDPEDFERFLRKLDLEISLDSNCGETTAIVGKIINGMVVGASCGDSEAWLLGGEFDYKLTHLQYRKPLIGSGNSVPIGFGPMELSSSLVIGSDGLFKYADQGQIKITALRPGSKAEEIANLAKTKNGKLQDDISVIIIRKTQ